MVGRVSQLIVASVVGLRQERTLLVVVVFSFGEIAGLVHLIEHDCTAVLGLLWTTDGVVERRVLQHTHEHSRLLDIKLGRELVEIDAGRRTDADGIVAEVEMVEIHIDDLLLGVKLLELHGNDPFDGFLHGTFPDVRSHLLGIDLLGKLLGDGGAATCRTLVEQNRLEYSTEEGLDVDAGVVEETSVLGSYERIDQVGRQLVVIDEDTVFLGTAETTQFDGIGRIDDGGILALRIFKFLDGWHLANVTI